MTSADMLFYLTGILIEELENIEKREILVMLITF